MTLIVIMARIYRRPTFANLLARKETVRYVRALCEGNILHPN